MKANDSIMIRVPMVCIMSMFHLALMPLALGATIGSEVMIRNQISPVISENPLHSSPDEGGMRGGIAVGGVPLHLVRHIRSVDHQQQGSSGSGSGNGIMELQEDNNSIQSNSESEEEGSQGVGVHKAQKSFVSSDMFPQPQENVVRMQSAPKGVGLHKWLFRGVGQSQQQFPRGLRRDSHFIRFGRNSNLDFDGFNLATASNNNGNKKNNFIRLGRENPRRNNFIRLGRSGLWGNNERFGAKVGYFPDYYSQLLQGNPNIWDFAQQQPVPFDPSDIVMQG